MPRWLNLIVLVALLQPAIASSSVVRQQVNRDVAVVNLQTAAGTVLQGDLVVLDVTVVNLGLNDETLDLQLENQTSGKLVDSVGVTLSAGQSLTLGLTWDTTGSTEGEHHLVATSVLPGDEDAANDSVSLLSPISIVLADIQLGDGHGGAYPDASFARGLGKPATDTSPVPGTEIFLGNSRASYSNSLNLVSLETAAKSANSFFLLNTDAQFSPQSELRNPFLQGQLQGKAHLEGTGDSRGIIVEAGEDTAAVDQDGDYVLLLPEGTYDVSIRAPGHIPVNIPGVEILADQAILIPELTLPFGDANGDGRIDIMDLSLAAENFGATVQELQLP